MNLNLQTASEKVFAIPELLEIILLNLSPIDLLTRAQLVNHTLHTCISSSTFLQQALFLAPAPDSHPFTPNPFLDTETGVTFRDFLISKKPICLLSLRSEPRSGSSERLLMWWEHPAFWDRLHLQEGMENPALYKNASWRKMLVSQPPVRELTLTIIQGQSEGQDRSSDVRCEEGVTLGMLESRTLRYHSVELGTLLLVLNETALGV